MLAGDRIHDLDALIEVSDQHAPAVPLERPQRHLARGEARGQLRQSGIDGIEEL